MFSSSDKKQLSIHKIRELQLDIVDIEANYDVIKEIGSGDYGKVILAVHKVSKFEVEETGCRITGFTNAFPPPAGSTESCSKSDDDTERLSARVSLLLLSVPPQQHSRHL